MQVALILVAAFFTFPACAQKHISSTEDWNSESSDLLHSPTKKHHSGVRKLFSISNHKAITQSLISEIVQGLKFRQFALDEVKVANANVDYFGFADSKNHCDDELLTECSQKILDDLKRAEDYLKRDPPGGDFARSSLGAALHTLQDFYAHSNWADLNTNDGDINAVLGVGTVPNPPKNQRFCTETDVGQFLPGVSTLTSGYFSLICDFPPAGKCSHGPAPYCSSFNGINKDEAKTTVAQRAYNQATKASSSLLKNLLARPGIGKDQVAALFGLKSFAVVLDTTGSMGDDLSSVQSAITNLVNIVLEETPVFVLVPFNDPSIGPAIVTPDSSTFLSSLYSLSVYGGGDCPELAMGGILLAVQNSLPGGIIYVFTDADAKDIGLYSFVRAEAWKKRVTIHFGLTGTCSRRRVRRGLQSGTVDPLYIQLALETGGQVFSGPRDDVGNILANIDTQIQDDFVTLGRYRVDLPAAIPLPVDDTLTSIMFSISSFDGIISAVQIRRPDGVVVNTDTDPGVSKVQLGNNVVVTIQGPGAGVWNIDIGGTGASTILAQGNSQININFFQFMQTVLGRYEEMLIEIPGGNPISDGEFATALARVEGPVASGEFGLADIAGNVINSLIEMGDSSLGGPGDSVLIIEIPDSPFSIFVEGVTASGHAFQRLAIPVYTPQVTKVSFNQLSLPDVFPPGSEVVIEFIVENFGIDTITVDLTVMDTLSYIASYNQTQAEVPPGGSASISVVLIFPDSCFEDVNRITATASLVGEFIGNSDIIDIIVCKTPPPTRTPTSTPTLAPTKSQSKSGKKAKSGT